MLTITFALGADRVDVVVLLAVLVEMMLVVVVVAEVERWVDEDRLEVVTDELEDDATYGP